VALKDDILALSNLEEFSSMAMKVFNYQAESCEVYKKYIHVTGRTQPTNIFEIPFLPIEFFKKFDIVSKDLPENSPYFLSSGTSNSVRSKHWVLDMEYYLSSCEASYRKFIGNPEEQVILALLPNYLEQGNSGLVRMVEHLINLTNDGLSGFMLSELDEVFSRYEQALQTNKKVVIFGVSYSLMDLADKGFPLMESIIIETGGMKGRREELPKKLLHDYILNGTSCKILYSEYGMTELFSQAYAKDNLLFITPPWMKIITSDPSDPFSIVEGRRGVINVIDLANIDSCSFIQTQDIGINTPVGFSIEGRMQQSDIRGCNQLVE